MIKILPSASNTEVFINCPWPWDKTIEHPPEGAGGAEYGIAFHALQAAPMREWKTIAACYMGIDGHNLVVNAKIARRALLRFLAGGNPWGLPIDVKGAVKERSYNLNLKTGTALECDPPSEDEHVYPKHKSHEMRGTVDLLIRDEGHKVLLILDYKTGWVGVWDPAESGQLKTLMLMAMLAYIPEHERDLYTYVVAIMNAKDSAEPVILPETISSGQLMKHLEHLRGALSRVGTGFIRPSSETDSKDWCHWCPAREICPIKTGQNVQAARQAIVAAGALLKKFSTSGELTLDQYGKLHMVHEQFEKLWKGIYTQMRDETRVRGNGSIARPDGKVLTIETRMVERLSKSSVTKALGSSRGARELDRLRKLGCIPMEEQELLRAVEND